MIVEFRARIRIRGVNPYVLVPGSVAARLSATGRGPLPVRFRVNGVPAEPWALSLMPAGDGSFYLYLNSVVRGATATRVGDSILVEMAPDASYRGGPIHPMPAELREHLAAFPRARSAWEALRPSLKKEVLRYLARLKGEAARRRNIELAIRALEGERVRFLGRSWNHEAARRRGAGS